MVRQVAQQPAQGHFRLSGLEAALERSLGPPLGLGATHAFAEEIRSALRRAEAVDVLAASRRAGLID